MKVHGLWVNRRRADGTDGRKKLKIPDQDGDGRVSFTITVQISDAYDGEHINFYMLDGKYADTTSSGNAVIEVGKNAVEQDEKQKASLKMRGYPTGISEKLHFLGPEASANSHKINDIDPVKLVLASSAKPDVGEIRITGLSNKWGPRQGISIKGETEHPEQKFKIQISRPGESWKTIHDKISSASGKFEFSRRSENLSIDPGTAQIRVKSGQHTATRKFELNEPRANWKIGNEIDFQRLKGPSSTKGSLTSLDTIRAQLNLSNEGGASGKANVVIEFPDGSRSSKTVKGGRNTETKIDVPWSPKRTGELKFKAWITGRVEKSKITDTLTVNPVEEGQRFESKQSGDEPAPLWDKLKSQLIRNLSDGWSLVGLVEKQGSGVFRNQWNQYGIIRKTKQGIQYIDLKGNISNNPIRFDTKRGAIKAFNKHQGDTKQDPDTDSEQQDKNQSRPSSKFKQIKQFGSGFNLIKKKVDGSKQYAIGGKLKNRAVWLDKNGEIQDEKTWFEKKEKAVEAHKTWLDNQKTSANNQDTVSRPSSPEKSSKSGNHESISSRTVTSRQRQPSRKNVEVSISRGGEPSVRRERVGGGSGDKTPSSNLKKAVKFGGAAIGAMLFFGGG